MASGGTHSQPISSALLTSTSGCIAVLDESDRLANTLTTLQFHGEPLHLPTISRRVPWVPVMAMTLRSPVFNILPHQEIQIDQGPRFIYLDEKVPGV